MADPAPQSSFLVYSSGGKYAVLPASAQAILGEYVEDGESHGHRAYRRRPTEAQKRLPDVFLFYWDARDGEAMSGWWFGSKIGGGQVWSRNASESKLPPQKGWCCPVDGPPLAHLLCIPKVRPKRELPDRQASESSPKRPAPWRMPPKGTVSAPVLDTKQDEVVDLVLSSTLGKAAPAAITALCGHYKRRAYNHGRPTYYQEDANCWLYYWDDRNGQDLSGWWLGRRVGGAEVFGLAQSDTVLPPEKGWRIPHDEALRWDVLLRPSGLEVEERSADKDDTDEPLQEDEEVLSDLDRLQKVRDLVINAEASVQKALETSTEVMDPQAELFEDSLKAIVELLQARQSELEANEVVVARQCKAARKQDTADEVDADLTLLEERFAHCIGSIQQELGKAQRLLEEFKIGAGEERDAKVFEATLSCAMDAVAQADLISEGAASASARKRGRRLLSKALAEVRRGLSAAQSFSAKARHLALTEFDILAQRCQKIAKRLDVVVLGTHLAEDHHKEGDDNEEDMDEILEEEYIFKGVTKLNARDFLSSSNEAGLGYSILETQALISKWSSKVAEYEACTQNALETSQVVLRKDSDPKGATLCLQVLKEQNDSVRELQQEISRHMLSQHEESLTTFTEKDQIAARALGGRLRILRGRLNQEICTARRQAAKASHASRDDWNVEAALNDQYARQATEAAMPLIEASVIEAEDAVDHVVQQAGDLASQRKQIEVSIHQSHGLNAELEKELDEIQDNAEKAQEAVDEARLRLDRQAQRIKRFPAEACNEDAFGELQDLRTRLDEAQQRLWPFMEVRAEFDMQLQAKEEAENLEQQLLSFERSIQQALGGEDESLNQDIDLLKVEGPTLLKRLKAQISASSSALRSKLKHLEVRTVKAIESVSHFEVQLASDSQLDAAQVLLQHAQQAAIKAECWLKHLDAADELWMNEEVLPEAESEAALKSADELLGSSEKEVRDLKETVENLLLSAEEPLISDIQVCLRRIDDVVIKLERFSVDTSSRKTKALLAEAVQLVRQAESDAKILEQAIGSLVQRKGCSSEEVSSTIDNLTKVVRSSSRAARECLASHGLPQAKPSSSIHLEIAKLSLRLDSADCKLGSLLQSLDKVKLLQEAKAELADLKEKSSHFIHMDFPSESIPDKAATFKEFWTLHLRLCRFHQTTKVLQQDQQGKLKDEVSQLLEAFSYMQHTLQEVQDKNRNCFEEGLSQVFQSATLEVEKAETSFEEAEDAESPFLKGIEVLPPELSETTLARCEAAAGKTRKTLDEVELFLSQAQHFANSFSKGTNTRSLLDFLSKLSVRCQLVSSKLAQFRLDTEERKRIARRHQGQYEPSKKRTRI